MAVVGRIGAAEKTNKNNAERLVRAPNAGAPTAEPGSSGSRLPKFLAREPFAELITEFDQHERVLWYYLNPPKPNFTTTLMEEIARLQAAVQRLFDEEGGPNDPPVRYMVAGSRMPGIFNLGGDLELFHELIVTQDRAEIENYARLCIDLVYTNAINLDLPLITVSVVQGDALGGGFEAALSSNLVIAERGSKFGLPEILFNLFPGMGAYSLLARRIDPAQAERMIMSGQIFSAEQLYEMGIVDMLADEGKGEAVFYEYLDKHSRQFDARRSIYKVRQQVKPLTYDEMANIAEIWVDAAMALSASDLNRMSRLAKAQLRRWNRINGDDTPSP